MNDLNNTTTILKSLSDKTRLSIVRHLANEKNEVACSRIVSDCANSLQLSQATMSHHFNRLVHADVLIERKSGTQKYYRLNHQLLTKSGIDPTKL